MKYVCDTCGYVYDPAVGDPDNGIEPGTPFEELPEDWGRLPTSRARRLLSLMNMKAAGSCCSILIHTGSQGLMISL